MKIIDISMNTHEGMMVYPGNPKPRFRKYSSLPRRPTNESLLTFGSHAGTHVDAPLHVKRRGASTQALPLSAFYGECRVLDLTAAGKEIRGEHLKPFRLKRGEIILLKTENSLRQYRSFRKDFVSISRDAAHYMVRKRIKTLGVDYLSVNKFGSDSDVHGVLLGKVTLVEGLCLKAVKPGRYVWSAFPLKMSCDGAPLRAVLIKT